MQHKSQHFASFCSNVKAVNLETKNVEKVKPLMCFYSNIKGHRGLLRRLWEAKSVFVHWIKATFQGDKMFFKKNEAKVMFIYWLSGFDVLTSKLQ